MVSSARVQQLVKGDDAVLSHQIVGPATLDAVKTVDSIELDTGDVARAVYEDAAGTTPISQVAGPEGDLPTSRISVALNQVQTALLKAGLGLTVRVEITRQNGKKESYYLFNEVDVLDRAFPTEDTTPSLP